MFKRHNTYIAMYWFVPGFERDFHNQTKMNWWPFGRLTFISNKAPLLNKAKIKYQQELYTKYLLGQTTITRSLP